MYYRFLETNIPSNSLLNALYLAWRWKTLPRVTVFKGEYIPSFYVIRNGYRFAYRRTLAENSRGFFYKGVIAIRPLHPYDYHYRSPKRGQALWELI